MPPYLNINNVPGPKSGILKLQKDFFILNNYGKNDYIFNLKLLKLKQS